MEAIDLLLTRRSAKAALIEEPGPDPDQLKTLLTAGIRVPDHGKLYPWRIQVLDKEAQRQLGEICAELFQSDHPNASAEQIEVEKLRPCHAPTLLVVTNRITPNHKIPESEQVLSGGAMCQNLLNASHALGFFGLWLTEWPTYDARVSEALGHPPDADTIGWIYIGSASEAPTERRRAALEDVVTYWPGDRS